MNPKRLVGAMLRKAGLMRGGDEFEGFAAQFLKRCRRWPLALPPAGGARIGIVVTPWMRTATPFFSIECALELARAGAHPVLLWDEANVFANAPEGSELKSLRHILQALEGQLEIINVAAEPMGDGVDTKFVEQLLFENAVREQRAEATAVAYLAENRELAVTMQDHARRVNGVLARGDFAWILVPGGFWAVSGLWTHQARVLGTAMTTFDCGPRLVVLGHGGPAAHYPDIMEVFRKVKAGCAEAGRARLVEAAFAAFRNRMAGNDVMRLQPPAAGAPIQSCDLLVPLNYRLDTAALERQRAFASVTDWLTQLLEWLSRRADLSVAIREHPCEKIPVYKGAERWQEVLAPWQEKLGSRMRFIAGEDPVNTYDLLETARVVLPWTSRTGIEGAMLGKPVVIGTECYYRGCGFTEDTDTAAEYFTALERVLSEESRSTPQLREDAALLYFLIEECLLLSTPFTPLPNDFREWVELPPEKLWDIPGGRMLREAFLTRQPASFLQFSAGPFGTAFQPQV